MKPTLLIVKISTLFVFLILINTACNSQKETVASRGMQNLTAHYNILYNANVLLDESENNIELSYIDNYDRMLSVFPEPDENLSQSEAKNLDEIILKANIIANEKSKSKYVDEAFFIIGKANHLKANFFNAIEFFTYVTKTYPKEVETKQAALAWKARSLMQLERFEEAEDDLDSALKYINSEKKSVADIYAAKAQLNIYGRKDGEAILMLSKAIKHTKDKQNRIRWTYLMAQLQEFSGKVDSAYINYSAIVKSNANFNMAFNAQLNRISIEDEKSGRVTNKIDRLKNLLKDDKNKDFKDQIYFHIANAYFSDNNIDKSIDIYNTSLRQLSKNQNQKGLAYLRLADIYFDKTDYIKSKNYYDSALVSFLPTYPEYELVKKKSDNLELLADRLTIIAREDTLQMLARLPESERNIRIGALVKEQAQKTLSPSEAENPNSPFLNANQQAFQVNKGGKYYFNNSTAISQGFSDFKKRWGNRKLEDNWRRSQKSAMDVSNSPINPDDINSVLPINPDLPIQSNKDLQKTYIDNIPLTADQMLASGERIASAYYDIGEYYREVLGDDEEAIRYFQLLLKRYPDSKNKLAAYYNLYRLNVSINPGVSSEYKNLLLTRYPNSPFAKIILDPNYNLKTDEQEIELFKVYNNIYDLYVNKDYTEVKKQIEAANNRFNQNKLSSQLAYLSSLALGHTQKLPYLESSFKKIIVDFPEDKLVVPLIKQQLEYIENNRTDMSSRTYALLDHDQNLDFEEPVNEPAVIVNANAVVSQPTKVVSNNNSAKVIDPLPTPVIEAEDKPTKEKTEDIIYPLPSAVIEKENIPERTENIIEPQPTEVVETGNIPRKEKPVQVITAPVVEPEASIFAVSDVGTYYFVVNVLDPTANLNSSRFGIGQFNRTKFIGSGIKHQLKQIKNQNQLIFVGEFLTKQDAADYYRKITPLMPEIMKISNDRYNTFYISKQNLDLLNDREMVERYIKFVKKN